MTSRRDGWASTRVRPNALGFVLGASVVAIVVATSTGIGGTFLGATPSSPQPSSSDVSAASVSASPSPESRTPAPTPAVAGVPIVPVTDFRAAWDNVDPAELAPILAGISDRYAALELVAADAPAIEAALHVGQSADPARLVLAPDAPTLRADLAAHRDRLAFLRASEVDPTVRALAWQGTSLFGVHRVATFDGWLLSIQVPARASAQPPGAAETLGGPAYDPATAWTIVAGGDIMLDRRVADVMQANGVDFPFDGGTADITSSRCCSPVGAALPVGRRTGNAGAVRALISDATLSIANFENPAPDSWTHHSGNGLVFSADPALIKGVADAGFDWLSLANNHIGNFGAQGILDTIKNLDRYGIAHAGAGENLAAARRPSVFHTGGATVAILAYDTIQPAYAADATTTGTAQMTAAAVRDDIAVARAAGADLVIVFPHWGQEYTANPTTLQRDLAHAAIDAGADLVIGNHPHWAQAVEVYRGVPIFYCLGDLIFDIARSEQTLEGILPELTFEGNRLVQVRIRPYLAVEGDWQPNLLDPAGSGKVVMDQVFNAAGENLPW